VIERNLALEQRINLNAVTRGNHISGRILEYGVQIDPLLKSQIPLNHQSFAPFAVIGRLKPEFPRRRHRRNWIHWPSGSAQANLILLKAQTGSGHGPY